MHARTLPHTSTGSNSERLHGHSVGTVSLLLWALLLPVVFDPLNLELEVF